MIDIAIDLAVTWWQFTVVGILIAVGFIINMFGVDNKRERIGFGYNVMPKLRPLKIKTAGKGFWGAIWMWITGTRHWEVADDWHLPLWVRTILYHKDSDLTVHQYPSSYILGCHRQVYC